MTSWLRCKTHKIDYPAFEGCPLCSTEDRQENNCDYCGKILDFDTDLCSYCSAPIRKKSHQSNASWLPDPDLLMTVKM